MIKLNLATSCQEHELIKEYLQENVSEILAEKINNGVRIEKDGKTLINKKTLEGFMQYAQSEAKKLAEKGASFKAVHHSVVFGWAIHYFEEDSIEGTLFNEDGSEYKKPVPTKKKTATTTQPVKPVSKPKDTQFSLFDLMKENEEPKQEPVEKEDKVSPIYKKYKEVALKHINHIVLYRLGDFYEAFEDSAQKLSDWLDLTLTSRDFGLESRVSMVGFPYHISEEYFKKILEHAPIAVMENDNVSIKDVNPCEDFDLTEEEMQEFDGDISEPAGIDDKDLLETIKSIDNEIAQKLYILLDGKVIIS